MCGIGIQKVKGQRMVHCYSTPVECGKFSRFDVVALKFVSDVAKNQPPFCCRRCTFKCLIFVAVMEALTHCYEPQHFSRAHSLGNRDGQWERINSSKSTGRIPELNLN